jgi:hypothetical protein
VVAVVEITFQKIVVQVAVVLVATELQLGHQAVALRLSLRLVCLPPLTTPLPLALVVVGELLLTMLLEFRGHLGQTLFLQPLHQSEVVAVAVMVLPLELLV